MSISLNGFAEESITLKWREPPPKAHPYPSAPA